jgi:hypothetical protein
VFAMEAAAAIANTQAYHFFFGSSFFGSAFFGSVISITVGGGVTM